MGAVNGRLCAADGVCHSRTGRFRPFRVTRELPKEERVLLLLWFSTKVFRFCGTLFFGCSMSFREGHSQSSVPSTRGVCRCEDLYLFTVLGTCEGPRFLHTATRGAYIGGGGLVALLSSSESPHLL